MKNKFKKLVSFFAMILLAVTSVISNGTFASADTASSTPGEEYITIYYDNSYTNWDGVSLYYWGSAKNNWPGDKMTKEDSGKFSIKVPKGAESIIFNNDGKGEQSTDISNISDNDEYVGIQTIGGKVLMIKKVDGKIPEPPVEGDTTPKQINAHVGDDYSKVNLTYTTAGACKSKVTLKNEDGNVVSTYYGTPNFSYLSFKYNHVTTLDNLKPETKYIYEIEAGDKKVEGSFKTTSADNSKSSAKFAFLADCQVNSDVDAKAFGATCNELNKISDLDLVYIAGDITNNAGNEKQYENLFNNGGEFTDECQKMFQNHLLSITQGNHDVSDFSGHITVPSASEQVGDDVYSYNIGNARVIVLNLETAKSNENIRNAQREYLEKQVNDAKSKNQWVIVTFHKSIYTGASHIVDSDIKDARKYWSPILSGLNVDMVLEGHDHVYARGFITAEGQNANLTKNADGSYTKHDASPLYMVGGHAGGLKWYNEIDYKVEDGDLLTPNYSFLDIDSAEAKYNSDGLTSSEKKEQFYTIFEVTEDKISTKTYTLKYDTNGDKITKDPELYDEVTLVRNAENNVATGTATATATATTNTPEGESNNTADSSKTVVAIFGSMMGLALMASLKRKSVNR